MGKVIDIGRAQAVKTEGMAHRRQWALAEEGKARPPLERTPYKKGTNEHTWFARGWLDEEKRIQSDKRERKA